MRNVLHRSIDVVEYKENRWVHVPITDRRALTSISNLVSLPDAFPWVFEYAPGCGQCPLHPFLLSAPLHVRYG